MWEVIQHIGTPISLIAFLAAIAAYVILGNQKNKILLLQSLPEEKRWELLNKDLDGYNVTHDNLTREQKFELMKTVLLQKAEHRRRVMQAICIVSAIVALLAGTLDIGSFVAQAPASAEPALKLISILGQNENGQPRAKIIEKSDNNLLLNNAFTSTKSEIRIVTELGNTWLLGDNYQAFKDAINRKLKIKVLMFDFTNTQLRALARYSSQKGEGKQGYTPEEVTRGLEMYVRLLESGASVNFGTYNKYPWIRFTIFDDNAVSFVLRPMLNLSRPQPLYSTDPVIVKMFEGIYEEFERSSTMYTGADELNTYIKQYKASTESKKD